MDWAWQDVGNRECAVVWLAHGLKTDNAEENGIADFHGTHKPIK